MLKFIFGGLFFFLLFILLILIYRIWKESKNERISPVKITGEELPTEIAEEAMQPLKKLAQYYEKRDVELIDKCIDDTMLPDELLILGTNPKEIFCGREKARDLLWGDWKYWGKVDIKSDEAVFNRIGDAIHCVVRGNVKLDIWHFTIPIKITGVLRKIDDKWLISKLQFINDFNTNYIIFAWGTSIALIVSMLLWSVTCVMNI